MAKTKIEPGKMQNGIMNRNGHWYAVIKVKGKQIRKAAPDLAGAQLLLGQLREDAARGRVGLPKVQRLTLADFAPRYMEHVKTKNKASSIRRDELNLRNVLPALGNVRLADLNRDRIDQYMQDRRKQETAGSIQSREAFERNRKAGRTWDKAEPPERRNMSVASVNREIAFIRSLLNYAVEIGELDRNPAGKIRLPRENNERVPTLNADEETRLIDALPEWMRFVYRMAVTTGCRQGELLALKWRNIDFESGNLVIEKSKGGSPRTVPIRPDMLKELVTRRQLPEAPVIVTDAGTPPKALSVSQAFRRAARKAGRPDLRFHDTRHLAGSRLLAAGASLPMVADMLGHATLAMSRRYAHTDRGRLTSLVNAMQAPADLSEADEPARAVGSEEA